MILYHDSKIQGNLIGVRSESDPLKNTWSTEWLRLVKGLAVNDKSLEIYFQE